MAQNDQSVTRGITNDDARTMPSGVRVYAVSAVATAAIEVEELDTAGIGGDGVWLSFVCDQPFCIIWGDDTVPAPLEAATNIATPEQRCVRWPADVEYTRWVDVRAAFFRLIRAASASGDGTVRLERTSEVLGATNQLT